MAMRLSIFFYVAALTTLLLCSQSAGQGGLQGQTFTSQDGTQRGTIAFNEEATEGTVSSLSVGSRRASASSRLVIGPNTAQGSFTAEGDSESITETASVGGDGEVPIDAAPVVVPASVLQEEVAVASPEAQNSGNDAPVAGGGDDDDEGGDDDDDLAIEGQNIPQEAAVVVPQLPVVVPAPTFEAEFKKVCIINDAVRFQKELQKGHEATLVRPTRDGHVKIITAVELAHASTRSTIITYYIPEEIKERCNVTYGDLGLEERAGDGFSSITGHTSNVQIASGFETGTDPVVAAAEAIRANVFRSLCMQEFFRHFALHEECKEFYSQGPY